MPLARDGAARSRRLAATSAGCRGSSFPTGVAATADPRVLADAADLVIFAVPSRHLRGTVTRARAAPAVRRGLLSVVKGLEPGSLLRMSEVIAGSAAIAGRAASAALSGPNLAGEIARGLPASAVVAASDPALAERVVGRLGRREFRLYVNRDVLGVELCGALKNIVAIAAGAADALGFGDNGKAGLITRGLAEMTRVGIAAGANPLTFAGLAGVGDVIATCGSTLSRNHRLGEELAKGRTWAEIEAHAAGRRPRAPTRSTRRSRSPARLGVEMPIAQRGPQRPVRGQERPALPDRPARRASRRTSWPTTSAGSTRSGVRRRTEARRC